MAKIIVVGSHPDSLINFRYDMLKDLAKQNEVIACAPFTSDRVSAALAQINVKFEVVSMARTGLNPLADCKTLFGLYRLFRRVSPDVVLTYTSKPVIYGSLAAKLAGVPRCFAMITGLGSYFIHQDFKSKLVRLIMSFLYRISLAVNVKVFFQNRDDCADFAKFGIFNNLDRSVFINGSGVNLQHFSELPLPTNEVCFLMVARFIKAKGILEYLMAAKMLKHKYPHVRCLLVGWFEDKAERIDPATIDHYVKEGVIEYLGKLDDVRPALQRASVYVLPSYREGTPKSVLEAMACGRAIITTDVPGCRETVTQNGILVPAGDYMSLFIAMEQFAVQPELASKMGKISREIAEDKYAVEKINRIIFASMELNYE